MWRAASFLGEDASGSRRKGAPALSSVTAVTTCSQNGWRQRGSRLVSTAAVTGGRAASTAGTFLFRLFGREGGWRRAGRRCCVRQEGGEGGMQGRGGGRMKRRCLDEHGHPTAGDVGHRKDSRAHFGAVSSWHAALRSASPTIAPRPKIGCQLAVGRLLVPPTSPPLRGHRNHGAAPAASEWGNTRHLGRPASGRWLSSVAPWQPRRSRIYAQ